MSKPELPTIPQDALVTATGGVTREKTSSTDLQLQQTMQSITDSLSTLKNQNNNSSLSQMLPMLMVAKVVRDRNSGY